MRMRFFATLQHGQGIHSHQQARSTLVSSMRRPTHHLHSHEDEIPNQDAFQTPQKPIYVCPESQARPQEAQVDTCVLREQTGP